MAVIKFITTPADIIISLCHAGLLRNSYGLGSVFVKLVSKDSSTMPDSFTYPPRGSQPIPYSVLLFLLLYLNSVKKGLKNK